MQGLDKRRQKFKQENQLGVTPYIPPTNNFA